MNHWAAWGLAALALWMLVSGLDDLLIGFVSLFPKPFRWPSEAETEAAVERRIAIFVPLWNEHRVIGRMLERNLAAIEYSNFDVFAGVYRNDFATLRAVKEVLSRHPRVHLAIVPRDGPTSKGDCLNAVWAHMLEHEVRSGKRFEIVITHDAEDLVHPQAPRLINWFSRAYQMVQIPVLALPTPLGELTHGLYCNEFAEFQTKDIPVRQRMGGFLPSNGVGTGFERAALERLAETRQGRIFAPECLTEDYENGFALHALGYRQIFVPLRFAGAGPVATREYFPRRWRAAVRQRSRWVAGIALQGWQKHGWRAPWRQVYWFWRDRKGLVGNLLSPFANGLFLCGLAGWRMGSAMPPWLAPACAALLALSMVQMAFRARSGAAVYGWRFAAGVPMRMLWGNALNWLATVVALRQFFAAAWRNRALAWNKTEHAYPAVEEKRLLLGELLVRMRALPREDLEAAIAAKPDRVRLGEYLITGRKLTQADLYRALSNQAGIPLGAPAAGEVDRAATRALPGETVWRWRVLPYRIRDGQLHLLTTEVPSLEMTRELAGISTLDLRFRLVLPEEFETLARQCGFRIQRRGPVQEAGIQGTKAG